jgi:hypothetical protein
MPDQGVVGGWIATFVRAVRPRGQGEPPASGHGSRRRTSKHGPSAVRVPRHSRPRLRAAPSATRAVLDSPVPRALWTRWQAPPPTCEGTAHRQWFALGGLEESGRKRSGHRVHPRGFADGDGPPSDGRRSASPGRWRQAKAGCKAWSGRVRWPTVRGGSRPVCRASLVRIQGTRGDFGAGRPVIREHGGARGWCSPRPPGRRVRRRGRWCARGPSDGRRRRSR